MARDRGSSTLSGSNVLVVEDEALILINLEDELMELGCANVQCVRDVDAALTALDAGRVDIALLDIHLAAGATSFALARELTSRDIPFVFLSGSLGDEVPDGLTGAAFVEKPFSISGLAGALSKALDRRALAAT